MHHTEAGVAEHDAEISFDSAKPQLAWVRWTLDHRDGVPNWAYDQFQRLLAENFPRARVSLIVCHWYGDLRPASPTINKVAAKLKRPTYLGADALQVYEARDADRAVADAIRDTFTDPLRAILAKHLRGAEE